MTQTFKLLAFFILISAVAAEEHPKNLIANPGFDEADGRGWDERGKPITLDPAGAYGTSCCKVSVTTDVRYPGFYFVKSVNIPAQTNTTYTFKVLVKTKHTAGIVQPSVRLINTEGTSVGYRAAGAIEPGEHDWKEYQVTFTTDKRVATMQIYLIHKNVVGTVWYDESSLTRRPPRKVPPIGSGDAVTFDGGPGKLPMRIESVEERDGSIVIRTTGAEYLVEPAAGRILGSQRIEVQRPIVEARFPTGLKGLRVIRKSDSVCVLSNGRVDLGFQCDSLLVIAAADKTAIVFTGKIGGVWARYEGGNVLAIDDRGGVGIYPHVIPGSGLTIDEPAAPENLDKPGWKSTHTIGAGVRLGVSIFPPRPFNWEKSFKWRLAHTGGCCPPDSVLEAWSKYINHLCLHASAMWSGKTPWVGPYHHRDAEDFRRCLATCRRLGITVYPYMSPWYYHIRDADEFMKQLSAQKSEYGFGGVYYDGLYYDDWIESYRVMRMTRELFADGGVYIHTTIGPPLWSKTMWCPFIDTYADFVLRGEGYAAKGPDDPYVRYVAAGYRLSNAIGMMKGDKWEGVDAKRQREIMLSYNGRSRWGTYPTHKTKDGPYIFPGQNAPLSGLFVDWYFPKLDSLEREWRAGRWKP